MTTRYGRRLYIETGRDYESDVILHSSRCSCFFLSVAEHAVCALTICGPLILLHSIAFPLNDKCIRNILLNTTISFRIHHFPSFPSGSEEHIQRSLIRFFMSKKWSNSLHCKCNDTKHTWHPFACTQNIWTSFEIFPPLSPGKYPRQNYLFFVYISDVSWALSQPSRARIRMCAVCIKCNMNAPMFCGLWRSWCFPFSFQHRVHLVFGVDDPGKSFSMSFVASACCHWQYLHEYEKPFSAERVKHSHTSVTDFHGEDITRLSFN